MQHVPVLAKRREAALKALVGALLILSDLSSSTRRALAAAPARRGRPLITAVVELALSMAIGMRKPTAKAEAS